MSNKESAIQFLKTVALGNPKEGYEKFVAPNFFHHNLYFKGDRQSLLDAMNEAAVTHPNKSFNVFQAIEEGDRVMVHSRVVKESMDIAVVHIFRFEGKMIAEFWDLGQVIEKDCPNENGAF